MLEGTRALRLQSVILLWWFLKSSPGEVPSCATPWAAGKGLYEELPAHPKVTLKMARSLSSLSGKFLRGSSRVVCSSSFQSLV